MTLEPHSLGNKVKYRGQELYSHIAFALDATQLASNVGDMTRFLLPALRSRLPEAMQNMLKIQGNRPRMWEDF